MSCLLFIIGCGTLFGWGAVTHNMGLAGIIVIIAAFSWTDEK